MRRALKLLRYLAQLLVVVSPWPVKRRLLVRFWRYEIHPSAHIAPLAWIFPKHLVMEEKSQICALTVAIHIEHFFMGADSYLGRSNWITGQPKDDPVHYRHKANRDPSLYIGKCASITKSHLIDCTDRIEIGAYTTIAGYASQFITHGINTQDNRQDCKPIRIGAHCLVGTRVLILGGGSLPDRCVLGAGGVLLHAFDQPDGLYAGSPAKWVRPIEAGAQYFARTERIVY